MNAIVYLYGVDGEYSLSNVEKELNRNGIRCVIAKNWKEEDFRRSLLDFNNCKKILISSAHPGINERSGRNNIPVAKLRRLSNWEKVIFFPHDLTEPIRWEERFYLCDYDFLVSEYPLPPWILAYPNISRIAPLQRDRFILNMNQKFLFLPDDYYSFGHLDAENFISRFPFTQNSNVITKLVNVQGAEKLSESLGQEIRVLPPSIPGNAIVIPENGILITQGPSSVLTEAHVVGMPVLYFDEVNLDVLDKETILEMFPAVSGFFKSGDPLDRDLTNGRPITYESSKAPSRLEFLDPILAD
jgi:hypothetical protein